MLQRLLRCDALAGIVDKDLLEKVQKLRHEFVAWGDDFLPGFSGVRTCDRTQGTYRKPLHGLDKPSGCSGRVRGGIIELQTLKVPATVSFH